MSIATNIQELKKSIPSSVSLLAVSKTHTARKITEAYESGQIDFGENRVQELVQKQPLLPSTIRWHLIGHLQTNKVKEIAPFVSLIHSVDSPRLLQEINKQALRNNRHIDCLLQIYIASEETKFGLDLREATELLDSDALASMEGIRICGLMGMATLTEDRSRIRTEFAGLKKFFECLKQRPVSEKFNPRILSMGMSSDYQIAIEEGSTLIRLGSAIFGSHT
jgi:pyridoxal phosphate enzyme (YggS family)